MLLVDLVLFAPLGEDDGDSSLLGHVGIEAVEWRSSAP